MPDRTEPMRDELIEPLVSFDLISVTELNRCLTAWSHKMGPWGRPNFGGQAFHGLRHNGELVAVTAAARLIPERTAWLELETVDSQKWRLRRDEAFELGRVCAARPHLCRPVLRLWREFAFPAICRAHGWTWAISYQDSDIHSGNLYRFDGWAKLGESNSGFDQRTGKRGRRKIIWGWCDDAQRSLAVQHLTTVRRAAQQREARGDE